jgi:hypothetical protein
MLLGLGASAASATTIQYHVTFGAGNFTASPPGTEPPILVTGAFDIDIDVGLDQPTDNASGLHSTSITAAPSFPSGDPFPFQVDTPWSFIYDQPTDVLIVGGSAHGSDTIQFSPAENDFYLQIHSFSTANPLMWQLGFAQSRISGTQLHNPSGGALADGFVGVTAIGPVATTPLPAGLPLFLTALGAMGVAGWRRKRAGAPA